ncbi:MAG: helix-turn-helix transcriptional regulator [Clostridia bacterium]|nr:helix-turn-helix transcriptional regulator [Clostridia bacterium]
MQYEKIGAFIRERRKAAGLTQEKLAEQLGVSAKAVSKWENAMCLPDVSLYEPLCQQLGITIGQLFQDRETSMQEQAKDWLIDVLAGRLYPPDCSVPFEMFRLSLQRMAEAAVLMSSFPTRQEAVVYLMRESGLEEDECGAAYDFYKSMEKRR